jgi:hypothetical protein
MKKLIMFPVLLITCNVFGYWFFEFLYPGRIAIEITKTKNLVEKKNDNFQYFFKQKEGRYEIGIECFTFNPHAPDGVVDNEFPEITRRQLGLIFRGTAQFTDKNIDNTLLKTVNAHRALSALVTYSRVKPDFMNRKYVLVNSYLNKTRGVTVVYTMFNDEKMINSKQFKKDIAIFRFK